MHESFVRFGLDDEHLAGMVHVAHPFAQSADKPAVLLWNVGVYHRTGPQRQHVEIARALVQFGFHVLRFDLSGLGDSGSSESGLLGEDQEVQDIQSAMNFMEAQFGVKRFILIGFCSSAANAHPTAVRDARVAGLIMVDAYGYKTLKHFVLHFTRRIFSPIHYQRFLLNFIQRMTARNGQRARFFREFPARDKIQSEILALLQRAVKMCYVYTGGVSDYYNYAGQFWDMFPRLPKGQQNLQLLYFPEANHLFSNRGAKSLYADALVDFIVNNFALSTSHE